MSWLTQYRSRPGPGVCGRGGTVERNNSLCNSHGWGISARAHVQRYPHTALLYLGNGLADYVQIWYVGWGSLTDCLPQVMDGVHPHVRTCAPLFHKCPPCCFSVMAGPIALKFGVHLGTHELQVMQ